MIVNLLLDALANLLPLFDESALLVQPSSSSLVRWDAIHFLAIANHGYQFEQQWAFLPGLPLLIRGFNTLLGQEHGLKGVSLLISILTVDSVRVLYELTHIHLGSETIAHIACVLALIPSSPATLFAAPYNEPFFSYFSYRGMLFCARKQWFAAALAFAAATLFRSNGIFLAGFIIWGMLIQPHFPRLPTLSTRLISSAIYTIILSALVFSPFVYHNYTGYLAFCTTETLSASSLIPQETPSWCSNRIPSIYTHVQDKYWNNGLFKYWTFQQLPNFLMAAPPLVLLLTFTLWHLREVYQSHFASTNPNPETKPNTDSQPPNAHLKPQTPELETPFSSPSLTPHVLHALFISSLLLFASHTQIILRLGAAMPTLYWAAAWLWQPPSSSKAKIGSPKYGKWWVYWSAIWGMVSIVLWTAFLPPA